MLRTICRVFVVFTAVFVGGAAHGAPDWGAGPGDNGVAHFTEEERDTIFARDHRITVTDGVTLHVVEKYSLASMKQRPARALLMLTGTLVTSAQYNADISADPGFNSLDRAAREGFFAFSVDYEGYGESDLPADGRSITAERMLVQMGDVVEWIRAYRKVNRVDLLGASIGSSIATALGGVMSPINRNHIGKLVLTSLVYKDATPLMKAILFSPETQAALENAPNGYIYTFPMMYWIILMQADPAAMMWAFDNFPGLYAVGPTLEGFDLPVFDAAYGRAPALQYWGDADAVTPRSDVDAFQAEYGGPVRLRVAAGGGHAPNFEPVREDFWNAAFTFLESPARGFAHGTNDAP